MRILRRWTGLAGCLALALGLVACGETDKSVSPPAVNPFAAARVGTDTTLEVMTWNVENFPKTGATAGLVKEIIEGVQPDIVAVEEIADGGAFLSLDAQLAGWTGIQTTTDRYQNLGFLYREGAGLQHLAHYQILADHSSTIMRIPLVLEADWNGVPVAVIVVHLKAQESGSADDEKRRESCELLAEFVADQLAGRRVFIVGDMNDSLTDTADLNVFLRFLDDPDNWRFADLPIAQGPPAGFSYPSYNPPSHLDHILVTDELFGALDAPDALVTTMSQLPALHGGWAAYDRDVSDHLPVIVRLRP